MPRLSPSGIASVPECLGGTYMQKLSSYPVSHSEHNLAKALPNPAHQTSRLAQIIQNFVKKNQSYLSHCSVQANVVSPSP